MAAESLSGSFLVFLVDEEETTSEKPPFNSLSYKNVANLQRKQLSQKAKKQFSKKNSSAHAALLATPGVKEIFSYPELLTYVVHVDNIVTAQHYLEKLAKQFPEISHIGYFPQATSELDVSANAMVMSTETNLLGDSWWLQEPTLQSVTLGILDEGVDIQHPMLAHAERHFYCQPVEDSTQSICHSNLSSAHGTSMAGIYLSHFSVHPGITTFPNDENSRAPGPINNILIAKAGEETEGGRLASIKGLHWLLTQEENLNVFPDIINYSQGNGMICPNESTLCNPQVYSTFAILIDKIIDNYGVSFIKSAGNKDYSADKTTVTIPGDAYNLIVVGNLNPFDWERCTVRGGNREHFKIYATSSVSPTYAELNNDQARRLISVVAPGRNIDTSGLDPHYCLADCSPADTECIKKCNLLGQAIPGYDPNTYGYWRQSTGTSPAAPMVGSVASLLHASGINHPAAIKAVIINSADSWTSNDTPHPPSPDIDSSNCANSYASQHTPTRGTHYDRTYAWGVLNASNAYQQKNNVVLDTIQRGRTKYYYGKLADFDKVTLVWHKHFSKKLSHINLGLEYKENDVWIPLMEDNSLLNNVKQVSNGTATITPVNAEEFRIAITFIGNNMSPNSELFALASSSLLKK